MSKFEIYLDVAMHYRWRLKARNGQIVASSGEAFASRQNAVAAAKLVQMLAPYAIVEE